MPQLVTFQQPQQFPQFPSGRGGGGFSADLRGDSSNTALMLALLDFLSRQSDRDRTTALQTKQFGLQEKLATADLQSSFEANLAAFRQDKAQDFQKQVDRQVQDRIKSFDKEQRSGATKMGALIRDVQRMGRDAGVSSRRGSVRSQILTLPNRIQAELERMDNPVQLAGAALALNQAIYGESGLTTTLGKNSNLLETFIQVSDEQLGPFQRFVGRDVSRFLSQTADDLSRVADERIQGFLDQSQDAITNARGQPNFTDSINQNRIKQNITTLSREGLGKLVLPSLELSPLAGFTRTGPGVTERLQETLPEPHFGRRVIGKPIRKAFESVTGSPEALLFRSLFGGRSPEALPLTAPPATAPPAVEPSASGSPLIAPLLSSSPPNMGSLLQGLRGDPTPPADLSFLDPFLPPEGTFGDPLSIGDDQTVPLDTINRVEPSKQPLFAPGPHGPIPLGFSAGFLERLQEQQRREEAEQKFGQGISGVMRR